MSYEVVSEELTKHAAHLDELVDRLGTAISAAQTVSMSDEAYGLLCSFLPPKINPVEEEGMNALRAASEGLRATADNVRTTARSYEQTDEGNAESFKPLQKANEQAPADVRKIMQ